MYDIRIKENSEFGMNTKISLESINLLLYPS